MGDAEVTIQQDKPITHAIKGLTEVEFSKAGVT
jgi:hypothetical protein